ncbi:MAG TPA: type II toxin-antitoxin system RelE/ParE family toxin [Candidatus Acidoferrales bacterium]|nr:type II toxin-antitoxin system RelE/ParE family toxin [Candidatus Acidoferrales bacterium]
MVRIQEEVSPIDIYDIDIMPEAQRGFSAIARPNQRVISYAIDELASDPRPANSEPLPNAENLRRLAVGDYRVIYGITESKKTVVVELIRHKSIVFTAIAALALAVRDKHFSP